MSYTSLLASSSIISAILRLGSFLVYSWGYQTICTLKRHVLLFLPVKYTQGKMATLRGYCPRHLCPHNQMEANITRLPFNQFRDTRYRRSTVLSSHCCCHLLIDSLVSFWSISSSRYPLCLLIICDMHNAFVTLVADSLHSIILFVSVCSTDIQIWKHTHSETAGAGAGGVCYYCWHDSRDCGINFCRLAAYIFDVTIIISRCFKSRLERNTIHQKGHIPRITKPERDKCPIRTTWKHSN